MDGEMVKTEKSSNHLILMYVIGARVIMLILMIDRVDDFHSIWNMKRIIIIIIKYWKCQASLSSMMPLISLKLLKWTWVYGDESAFAFSGVQCWRLWFVWSLGNIL